MKISRLTGRRLIVAFAIIILVIIGVALAIAWLAPNKQPNQTSNYSYCVMRIEGEQCVTLEKVSSQSAREQGLSGREAIPRDHGMLFVFDESETHCMWMKDMNFAIDIIWLDTDGKIVEIDHDIEPDSYPQTFCNDITPARYVIEVNAGVAEAAGLRVGQTLTL